MLKALTVLFCFCLLACASSTDKSPLVIKTELPKELKEISGITAVGTTVWAITDKPHADFYKLDLTGKLLEKIEITNSQAIDVEAVTADNDNVYIGDVGDNEGTRPERQIIKVANANIKGGKATGEIIEFTFPGEFDVQSKKQNNFDCESLLSFKDSLYVFTKDREDKETRLYVIPKTPGKYTARFIDSFNSKGLVTDAAVNEAGNEVALIGYNKGHNDQFILLFSNFQGNDFFSGKHQRIELTDKPWDWQLEGITYSNGNIYFSCEGTKQVPATFYGIKRADVDKLNKQQPGKLSKKKDHDEPHISMKGHLKG